MGSSGSKSEASKHFRHLTERVKFLLATLGVKAVVLILLAHAEL
jgi:hypothetical protein